MATNDCCLETHPEFGGCCCQCKYHVEDHSHPDTDGLRFSNQRGWICAGFLFCEGESIAFSQWPEHGMCELFTQKQAKKVDVYVSE